MKQASLSNSPKHEEKWDFSRGDYLTLKASGGELRLSRFSGWVPAGLRRNLLGTLKFLLDPHRRPSCTDGVNIMDFNHGHLAICKGRLPKVLARKIDAFAQARRIAAASAFGTYQNFLDYAVGRDVPEGLFDPYLPGFRKAIEGLVPAAREIIEDAIALGGAVAIYHTYERTSPSDLKQGQKLLAGDPRRNYMTPLDGNCPAPYRPPSIRTAASTWREYDDVMLFSFLVDKSGQVHVSIGSIPELGAIAGRRLTS